MDLRALAEQGVAVGSGVTVIGGTVGWLFREKIAAFIDRRVERKLAPLVASTGKLEERMGDLERDSTVTGETVKNLASGITEHMARQTQALTAISTELTLQGKQLAEMRGELNARAVR